MHKSTNQGVSWTTVNSTALDSAPLGITSDLNNNLYIVAGSKQIYKSSNSGQSWALTNSSFSASANGAQHGIASQKTNTSLTYQIKSSNASDLTDTQFIGPDGTSSTFFSEQASFALSGKYFQYKTYFSTLDVSITPKLQNVTINYTETITIENTTNQTSSNNETNNNSTNSTNQENNSTDTSPPVEELPPSEETPPPASTPEPPPEPIPQSSGSNGGGSTGSGLEITKTSTPPEIPASSAEVKTPLENKFNIDIIKVEKAGSKLTVDYALKELSGASQSITIDYTISDTTNSPIRGAQETSLQPNEESADTIEIDIPSKYIGEATLEIKATNGQSTTSASRKILLNPKSITAFTIFENNKKTISLIGIILLAMIILLATVRFLYKHNKRVKDIPNNKRIILKID